MKTLIFIAIVLIITDYIVRYFNARKEINKLRHIINALKGQKRHLISLRNRKNRIIENYEKICKANDVIISIDEEQLSDYKKNYPFTSSINMIKINIDYFKDIKSILEKRFITLKQICSQKIKPSTALVEYWDTETKINECNQSIYMLENMLSNKNIKINFYSDYVKNKEKSCEICGKEIVHSDI